MGDGLGGLFINLILNTAVGILGFWGGFYILTRLGLKGVKAEAEAILSQARRQAESIVKEADLTAKEDVLQRRERLEAELEEGRREIRELERRLEKRSDALELRIEHVAAREREVEGLHKTLVERQESIVQRDRELADLIEARRAEVLKAAGLNAEEARGLVLSRLQEELAHELSREVLKHEQAVREAGRVRSREILATAIQRYAAAHTAETTVSLIDIPSDDMKGRIIGREGRNIRAFEKATGVDVIIDDTPGVVVVSAFDSVRREVAKLALEKLILDGRIHPSRIEDIVNETRDDLERHIHQAGVSAAQEALLKTPLHERLIDYLGRLKFRTSYSQNVLQHSLEVAFLTGMLAEEIGLDGALGRRCGLLHDIGKAAEHEMEGGHPAIGAELNKRYGEGPEVVHAALGHHDDLRSDRPYTVLVAAADAISASRPGARRDTLDRYVRRLEELEAVALGFPGVEHAYAIQAGREVRVIADSQAVNDEGAAQLCREIAKAIEAQTKYPGEVKVTVLRETRAVEFAR